MKKLLSGKIKTKMLIYSLIIAIIPILMVSYVSTSTISNLMDSNEESKVNVNMGILNERFDSVFVEFDTMTSYTANLNVVKDAVKRKDKTYLSDFAYNLENQSWVDLVVFTDSEGNVFCSSDEGTDANISKYVKKLLEKDIIYAFDVLPENEAVKYSDYEITGDALTIFAVAPVYDGETLIGTVTYVDIVNNDDYWVDRVKESTGGEASIFLNDMIISTTITENGTDIVGKTAQTGIYDHILNKNDYFTSEKIVGISYITKYSPIEDSDGNVIGMISVSSPGAPFIALKQEVLSEMVFSAVYALLFAAFIALIFTSSFTKPLMKLKKSAEIFGHGNYNYRADVKTGDELEDLANAFNKMAEEVSVSNQKLKERAENLKTSYDELKELDNLKTEILSIVSHELRTPLTSIKGYLELLRDGTAGALNERQQEFVEIIHGNVSRLKRHIDNMLDLVKVNHAALDVKFDQINIKSAVSEISNSLKYFADERHVVLLEDVDEAWIKGDKNKINQVLENLVENAIKFTKTHTKVTISGYEDGENLHLEIIDQGPGIPKENLEKIFEKFYQVDSSLKRDVRGSGLGLAVCKKIVESHHGSIWVESKIGKGTTVHLLLPIAK